MKVFNVTTNSEQDFDDKAWMSRNTVAMAKCVHFDVKLRFLH